jgi:hypothetical protein
MSRFRLLAAATSATAVAIATRGRGGVLRVVSRAG